MDLMEDPRELQRKIEQASRIASSINDQTTNQRLREFVEEPRVLAHLPNKFCFESRPVGISKLYSDGRVSVLPTRAVAVVAS